MMAVTYRHPVKKKLRRRSEIYFKCYENYSRVAAAVRPNIEANTAAKMLDFHLNLGVLSQAASGLK